MSKSNRNTGAVAPQSGCQDATLQRMQVAADSDQSLVALAQGGDSSAFGALAMRHRRGMLSLVFRITGSFDDAQDIVQEVFLKAFLNLSRYRGTAKFSTWLTRIAINEALQLRRKTKHYSLVPLSISEAPVDVLLLPELCASTSDPEHEVSQQQWRSLLEAAIGELKPKLQSVLQLRSIQEHTVGETAKILGLSPPAVKSREIRGRQALRQKLEHHWGLSPRTKNSESKIDLEEIEREA